MEWMLQRIQRLEKENEALSKLVDQYDEALTDLTAVQEMSNKKLREATDLMNLIMKQDDQQDDQIGIMPDCTKEQ
jgi:hypothetical protein